MSGRDSAANAANRVRTNILGFILLSHRFNLLDKIYVVNHNSSGSFNQIS